MKDNSGRRYNKQTTI